MWKDIKGFEGQYQVSNNGEIRSLDRYVEFKHKSKFLKGAIKRQQTGTNGYKIVKLCKNSKKYTFSVHRLVAEAFLEKPSYAECVNHINGIKTDNRLENLEWCTYSYNNKEAIRLNLKSKEKLRTQILKEVEKKKKKIIMYKQNEIITIKECSRDMAIYVKDLLKTNTSVETIARNIREICRQNESNINVKPSRKRKSAYGYRFNYL